MIRASRRIGAVLVLTGALISVPALAAQGPRTGEQARRPSVAQEMRASLASAWRHLTSLWARARTGSRLDPFGNPLPPGTASGTAPGAGPTEDTGSRLDPFG